MHARRARDLRYADAAGCPLLLPALPLLFLFLSASIQIPPWFHEKGISLTRATICSCHNEYCRRTKHARARTRTETLRYYNGAYYYRHLGKRIEIAQLLRLIKHGRFLGPRVQLACCNQIRIA